MNDSTTPLWLQVPEPSDLVKAFGSAVDVPAFGGRLEVNWAPGARVTSVGGLAYFATFLKTTGLFDRLCADFPVEYASNNASSKRDIVGTAVLAVLLGKTRCVHIEAIRHDELVERVLPPCRSDCPPRGDNLAPGVHVDHGPYRRERAKANNPPHFHACRFDADPAGIGHGRGVLQVAWFNCRAVGRKDALDNRRPLCFSQNPAPRPRIETIVRAQVARRTHFDWMKPGFASEAGRAASSRREKPHQLRFN